MNESCEACHHSPASHENWGRGRCDARDADSWHCTCKQYVQPSPWAKDAPVTTVRVVHDDHGSHWPKCLHPVAPHKLCTLRRDHKGDHLPLPKIPESGAA